MHGRGISDPNLNHAHRLGNLTDGKYQKQVTSIEENEWGN
jgi:hypothetical protein